MGFAALLWIGQRLCSPKDNITATQAQWQMAILGGLARKSSPIFKGFLLESRLAFWAPFQAPYWTWQAAARYYYSRNTFGFSIVFQAFARCTSPSLSCVLRRLFGQQEPCLLF